MMLAAPASLLSIRLRIFTFVISGLLSSVVGGDAGSGRTTTHGVDHQVFDLVDDGVESRDGGVVEGRICRPVPEDPLHLGMISQGAHYHEVDQDRGGLDEVAGFAPLGEDAGEQADDAAEVHDGLGGDVGPQGGRFAHEDAGQGRVSLDVFKDTAHVLAQLFLWGGPLGDGLGEGDRLLAQGPVQNGRIEGGFVAHVIVDGGLVDPGDPGDLVHARPGEALVGKGLYSGNKDTAHCVWRGGKGYL